MKKILLAYMLLIILIIITGVISTKTGFQNTKKLGREDIWCANVKVKSAMNPLDRLLVGLGKIVVVDGSSVHTYTIFRIPYKKYQFSCDGGTH